MAGVYCGQRGGGGVHKSLEIKGRRLEYELTRKKVKNINLRIRRDGSLAVSAPPGEPLRHIEDFVSSKAAFILSALAALEEQEKFRWPGAREGEQLCLLGQTLTLRLERGAPNRAERRGEQLVLILRDTENAALRQRTLDAFLRESCAQAAAEVCRELYPAFRPMGVPFPTLRFRRMKSRWGSCMPREKAVTFNTALVLTPPECLEYVAAHELLHFLHPSHSPDFYRSLSLFMPNWAEREKTLSNFTGLVR